MTDALLACAVAAVITLVFIAVLVARRAAPLDAKDLQAIDVRLKVFEKDLSDTKHDLNNVRMVVNNLPNKDAMHRMELELTAVSGKVATVEAETKATTRAVERVEDLILKRIEAKT